MRVLAEDIARALGTCGHVTALRRSWVEPFENEPMQTLEAVTLAGERGRLPLLPADRPLAASAGGGARGLAGRSRSDTDRRSRWCAVRRRGRVRLYDPGKRFLGLGESDGRGTVRPRRLFNGCPAPLLAVHRDVGIEHLQRVGDVRKARFAAVALRNTSCSAELQPGEPGFEWRAVGLWRTSPTGTAAAVRTAGCDGVVAQAAEVRATLRMPMINARFMAPKEFSAYFAARDLVAKACTAG